MARRIPLSLETAVQELVNLYGIDKVSEAVTDHLDLVMTVFIGRGTGPINDKEASAEMTEAELEILADTLAMVNAATNNKENWYYRTNRPTDTATHYPEARICLTN